MIGGIKMAVVLFIVYMFIGIKGVNYFKTEILGIVAEYDTIVGHLIKHVVYGVLLGWIAAPISFLHWLFVGRNR